MARLLSPPAIAPVLPRTAVNAVPSERVAPRTAASAPIDIAQLWRESLQTFSAHSVAMLACILFGLMSPFLVGHWIATQAVLQDMNWVGPVPALQEKLSLHTLAALACAGWLTSSFSRGVITWLALEGNTGVALRRTLGCFPALLASNLIYSALISICLLGLSLIMVSIDKPWDANLSLLTPMTPVHAVHAAPEQLLQASGSTLMSDAANAPFIMLLPEVRAALLWKPSATEYETWLTANNAQVPAPQSFVEQWQSVRPNALRNTAVSCIVLLIFTETLLRFRTITAFKPSESLLTSRAKSGGQRLWGFAALSPLIESVRFGWRRLGVITLHIWLLRIAGSALMLLMVALPMAAGLRFMMPTLVSLTGKTPLLPILYFVQSCIAVFVVAIVLAFNTIYDARLFMALRHASD